MSLRKPSMPAPHSGTHNPVSNHTRAPTPGMVHVMPRTSLAAKPRTLPRPLTADERAMCDRIATRLHADLSMLVEQLPDAARSGSGMAKHLSIVRNTTQRVVHALRDLPPDAQTLVKLPGTKGLEQMLAAMRIAGVRPESIEIAQVAVAQFEQLIDKLAGSHTRLAARINASAGAHADFHLGGVEARQALFRAAVEVTGRSTETMISLSAFRQSSDNPDILQRALVSGMLATTAVPGGMPVVIRAGNTLHWDHPEDRNIDFLDNAKPHGNTPEALLKDFTTHPLPTVTSQGTSDNHIQVIDPEDFDAPCTLDVFTAMRSNHSFTDPQTGNFALDEVWSLINCPSARLLFDVYLHRDLERRVRPAIDAQLWYPNLVAPGGQRWITRFPANPRLELLGEGISRAASPAHPRHAELTETLFSRVGWDPGQFVGFRCEADYPIWRSGYCMHFQHLRPDPPEDPDDDA